MVGYVYPPHSLFYCRSCEATVPHSEQADGEGIACEGCGRVVLTVEVIATYSTDRVRGHLEVLPPLRALDAHILAAKTLGWDWRDTLVNGLPDHENPDIVRDSPEEDEEEPDIGDTIPPLLDDEPDGAIINGEEF